MAAQMMEMESISLLHHLSLFLPLFTLHHDIKKLVLLNDLQIYYLF